MFILHNYSLFDLQNIIVLTKSCDGDSCVFVCFREPVVGANR
jgi:hypothetical protein